MHLVIILVIDIVSESLFLTPSQVRPFPAKPFVYPVFVERHCLRNTHGINEKTSSVSLAAAGADDPVPGRGHPANDRLTSRYSAYAEKWIGRKAIITGNDVGK